MQALTTLKGVGPVTAQRLAAAGYVDVPALAHAFPRRYRESCRVPALAADDAGRDVTVHARCRRATARHLRGRRNLTQAEFDVLGADGVPTGQVVQAAFFGRAWLAPQLPGGREVLLSGVLELSARGAWTLRAPRVAFEVADFAPGIDLAPVYPVVPGVAAASFRRLVQQAVARVLPDLREELAPDFLASHRMLPRPEAVSLLHRPRPDPDGLERARRRLALVEAQELLAAVRARRARRERMRAWPVPCSREVDERIRSRLPFSLSAEQEACVAALGADLAREFPMARLLQGDVGTGKTLVAAWAALAVTAAGLKAAILAPTEVLAEQHAARFQAWLAGGRLPVLLVTQSAGRRAELRRHLAADAPCLAIGTHALLDEKLTWRRLGLLVIDEQHRFGVAQRGRLFRESEGHVPHVLVMSATPIPRTMATALYGDLDLSEIRQPPVARPPVVTRLLPKSEWARVRAAIADEVRQGGRVFVVCPRIGEDEADGAGYAETEADAAQPEEAMAGALATFEQLRAQVPTVLVHGRQRPDERRAAQEAFRRGDVGCLVATTVVEVGVDVPEATWMVVRDAERLGLSSLHQLRGRVGRGGRHATCIYLGDARAARLTVLTETSDGFAIAEADLLERGAGELTGRVQHGHRRFLCLRPIEDLDILRLAALAPDSSGSRLAGLV